MQNQNDELLNKLLPFGTVPGDVHTFRYKDHTYLSCVFEINQQDERNDLVALSFALDRRAIIKNFEIVMQELITRLKESNLLSLDLLKSNLTAITEAINKESKIKIGNMIFDVAFFLKKKKMKLSENRLVKGGLL